GVDVRGLRAAPVPAGLAARLGARAGHRGDHVRAGRLRREPAHRALPDAGQPARRQPERDDGRPVDRGAQGVPAAAHRPGWGGGAAGQGADGVPAVAGRPGRRPAGSVAGAGRRPAAPGADRAAGARSAGGTGGAGVAGPGRRCPAGPGMRPLDGITVVGLEQAVAAPFATRQLADLGARVIKVERPGGDFARRYDESVLGQSAYFVWLNRPKESLTPDGKAPAGRAGLAALLARADVLVQNRAPGAARRLGLSAATLAADHPRLVVCDISGYGPDGPWADRKAYDLLVQCETGVVAVTGSPGQPARVGISI